MPFTLTFADNSDALSFATEAEARAEARRRRELQPGLGYLLVGPDFPPIIAHIHNGEEDPNDAEDEE